MKTILHIGSHKTGSSSLKIALAQQREQLLSTGVLYPESAPGLTAHHNLSPMLVRESDLWLSVNEYYGRDRAKMLAGTNRAWERIVQQVEYHRPDTLLLASEAFFNVIDGQAAPLWDRLAEISDQIHVVAYVRDPLSYCSAFYIEESKRLRSLPSLQPIRYRPQIESFTALPKAEVTVRNYDRSTLIGADIITDFNSAILQGRLKQPPRSVASNPTLSAEAALIFQRYKAQTNSGPSWQLERRDRRILARLQTIDAAIGDSQRPVLRPHIKAFIRDSFQDAEWLRARHGIAFPIEYSGIGESCQQGLTDGAVQLDQIFDLDDRRLAAVHERLETELPELWHLFEHTPIWHPDSFKYTFFRNRRRFLNWIGLGEPKRF